jgi:hypothetical protein
VIEQRLAAAVRAVRERDLCTRQHRQLSAREQTAAAEAAAARKEYAGAEQDVERLGHLSLARVLAALHGAREDALAREEAEAQAARYRVRGGSAAAGRRPGPARTPRGPAG